MADLKISQLTGATTPLAGTEVVPLVQSSATKNVAVSDLTAGRQVAVASAVAGTGAAPIPWVLNSTSSFYQVSTISSVLGSAGIGGVGTEYVRNAYYDGAWKYVGGGTASRYVQTGGQHIFYRAVSGTTGSAITWIQNLTLNTSDDLTLNAGNVIFGTAGKGVNFTANTPAAGKTSQLLNWYEEGTFTPTIASVTGTITSYTASGTYTRIGRVVTLTATVTITNNGTGATGLWLQNFPFTAGADSGGVTGREGAVTGKGVIGSVNSGATRAFTVFYDGTYPGGTNYTIAYCVTYTV